MGWFFVGPYRPSADEYFNVKVNSSSWYVIQSGLDFLRNCLFSMQFEMLDRDNCAKQVKHMLHIT